MEPSPLHTNLINGAHIVYLKNKWKINKYREVVYLPDDKCTKLWPVNILYLFRGLNKYFYRPVWTGRKR